MEGSALLSRDYVGRMARLRWRVRQWRYEAILPNMSIDNREYRTRPRARCLIDVIPPPRVPYASYATTYALMLLCHNSASATRRVGSA